MPESELKDEINRLLQGFGSGLVAVNKTQETITMEEEDDNTQ